MADTYIQEMDWSDPKVAELFIELIDKRIEKKLKELKFNKSIPAVVSQVGGILNNATGTVRMNGSTVDVPVLNKSGVSLNNGDFVYLEAINSSTNNMYIKVKI